MLEAAFLLVLRYKHVENMYGDDGCLCCHGSAGCKH